MDLEDELFGSDDESNSSNPSYLPISPSKKSITNNNNMTSYMAPLPPPTPTPPIPPTPPPLIGKRQSSAPLINFDVEYEDWHIATEKLEYSYLDQRLTDNLSQLRTRHPGHMLQTKERNAELEILRRKDEVNGCHKRQKDRELLASQVVISKMEIWRNWNGARDNDSATNNTDNNNENDNNTTGNEINNNHFLKKRMSFQQSIKVFKKHTKMNKTSNEKELMLESPIRALFGGLNQYEHKISRIENSLIKEIFYKHDRSEGIELLSSYLQVILRVPPVRLTDSGRSLWLKYGIELGSKHSLGTVASAYTVVMSGLYDAACLRAESRGSSARPAVDYASNDVRSYIAFQQAIILWKWQDKLELIMKSTHDADVSSSKVASVSLSSLPQTMPWVLANDEPARGILEALDKAVLPSVPVVYRLFRASSQDVDEVLSSKLGLLARLDPCELCSLLGINPKYQMDIEKIRSNTTTSPSSSSSSLSANQKSSTIQLQSNSSYSLEDTYFGYALSELKGMGCTLSPTLKTEAIAKTCRALCVAVGQWSQYQQSLSSSSTSSSSSSSSSSNHSSSSPSLAADDMLPMLMLLIIYGCVTESYGGSLRSLEAEGAYMECFLPEHLASSEEGYCLVLFRTAVGALHSVSPTIVPPSNGTVTPPPVAKATPIITPITNESPPYSPDVDEIASFERSSSMDRLANTCLFNVDGVGTKHSSDSENTSSKDSGSGGSVAPSNVSAASACFGDIESIVSRTSDIGLQALD